MQSAIEDLELSSGTSDLEAQISDLQSAVDDANSEVESVRSELASLCDAIGSAYTFADIGSQVEEALFEMNNAC